MSSRLRDMREDRDLTQAKLAEYLKIHQTTYSDYEIGKLNVPIDVFIALAKYYDTSIDYLAGITDNPKPYRE
jgi:transcriptional regulator with XRE-family HTH domain